MLIPQKKPGRADLNPACLIKDLFIFSDHCLCQRFSCLRELDLSQRLNRTCVRLPLQETLKWSSANSQRQLDLRSTLPLHHTIQQRSTTPHTAEQLEKLRGGICQDRRWFYLVLCEKDKLDVYCTVKEYTIYTIKYGVGCVCVKAIWLGIKNVSQSETAVQSCHTAVQPELKLLLST